MLGVSDLYSLSLTKKDTLIFVSLKYVIVCRTKDICSANPYIFKEYYLSYYL